ncbi:unnamed protein product [Ilex paraguariensis]|uniref:Phosphoinositide phospholipase C n=1 Tax=Ilex paraguariensis TaxID=185542 RepID=A0ABC8T7W6_9AQUA
MLFCLKEFPSREELKYRIIISTKPPKECVEDKSFQGKQNKSQNLKDSDECVWGKEQSSLTSDDSDQQNNDKSDSDWRKPKAGLKEALRVGIDKVRQLSLSEQALENAAESYGLDVVRFTQKHILRVYPIGTRFNSSNYNPRIGWMHGAQMVAFNMQGYDKALWLMHGMFRSNGRCGYVKKPDFLTNIGPHNQLFNPKARMPVKKTLKVKLYMGDGWHLDFKKTHFDLYSPPDSYTRVGIAGVPADEIMKKTKIKKDSWTPVWDEEFSFPLTVPELALLRIEVKQHDIAEKNDFAGQTCSPVSELRPGICAVPLCDQKGKKFNSVRLLMCFEFV